MVTYHVWVRTYHVWLFLDLVARGPIHMQQQPLEGARMAAGMFSLFATTMLLSMLVVVYKAYKLRHNYYAVKGYMNRDTTSNTNNHNWAERKNHIIHTPSKWDHTRMKEHYKSPKSETITKRKTIHLPSEWDHEKTSDSLIIIKQQ